jgi:ABC-type multidrug transport system fused ATPase/permease subunit
LAVGYDESISDQDPIQAVGMAGIIEFIKDRPQGFDTIIGERRIMLSAGRRQRIVIVRVLTTKPKLMILDEATSALANQSEVQIQKVINNLKGRVTILAIARRLSTVMDSDKLVVLQEGIETE